MLEMRIENIRSMMINDNTTAADVFNIFMDYIKLNEKQESELFEASRDSRAFNEMMNSSNLLLKILDKEKVDGEEIFLLALHFNVHNFRAEETIEILKSMSKYAGNEIGIGRFLEIVKEFIEEIMRKNILISKSEAELIRKWYADCTKKATFEVAEFLAWLFFKDVYTLQEIEVICEEKYMPEYDDVISYLADMSYNMQI